MSIGTLNVHAVSFGVGYVDTFQIQGRGVTGRAGPGDQTPAGTVVCVAAYPIDVEGVQTGQVLDDRNGYFCESLLDILMTARGPHIGQIELGSTGRHTAQACGIE